MEYEKYRIWRDRWCALFSNFTIVLDKNWSIASQAFRTYCQDYFSIVFKVNYTPHQIKERAKNRVC